MASSWEASATFTVSPWRIAFVSDSSGRVPMDAVEGVGLVRRRVVVRSVVWRWERRVWRLVGLEEGGGGFVVLSSLLSFVMD